MKKFCGIRPFSIAISLELVTAKDTMWNQIKRKYPVGSHCGAVITDIASIQLSVTQMMRKLFFWQILFKYAAIIKSNYF